VVCLTPYRPFDAMSSKELVIGSLTGNVGAPTDSYYLFQLRNVVELVWPLVLFIILVAVRNRQNYGATNIPDSK